MSQLRLNCKPQFLNTWKGTFIESNDILSILKPVVHRPSTPWCVFLYSTRALFVLINTSSVKLPSLDVHREVSMKDSVIDFLALIWLFSWRPNYRWREGFRVCNQVFLVLFRMTNDRAEITTCHLWTTLLSQPWLLGPSGWKQHCLLLLHSKLTPQNPRSSILWKLSSIHIHQAVISHLFSIHWVPIRAQLKSCSESPPVPHTLSYYMGPAYH